MGTTSPKAVIMDETAVNRAMTRIAHEILERNEGCEDLALVGIVTRGDLLAKKLAEEIKEIEGVDVPLGSLDISFYRDDYATNFAPAIHATNIPFSVDGKRVVLVDDILYTGRTIRAALEKHGFALESVCDGESFGPLTDESERYFFCAVKQYTQLEEQ